MSLTQATDADNTMLRINAGRVAELMDLVGELSLASDEVIHHPELQQLDQLTVATNKLSQLVRELQDIVSNLRLVPIEGVFRKMQRLARDLAKQTGKKFKFILEGEDTEIDKVVVDMLSDPLVHIIRNSVDHGLEMPQDRIAKGKSEEGEVRLSARQESGDIIITITDDGGGLNRERILSRAIEKGLVSKEEQLSDESVWELIFAPGFSTKDEVSQLSGRGVGMDVVKTTIHKVRGRVDIFSKEGQGSCLKLVIPLSVAFLNTMVIQNGNRNYAVSIDGIAEVLQSDQVQLVKNSANGDLSVKVRNQLLPIFRLFHHTLEIERYSVFLIVQVGTNLYAIPVENILGQYQVSIKPLVGCLSDIHGLSGCAILPDGDISWVLDVAAIPEIIAHYGGGCD